MQPRAQATRAALLDAAAHVFENYGYAATIAQILDQAGVTKGSLYFHFDSKESLANAIVAEQQRWRTENEPTGGQPLQRMVDISYQFVDALMTDQLVRASIRLTLERNTFDQHDPSPYEGWVDTLWQLLTEAQERGDLKPAVDPLAAARVITSTFTGMQLMSEAATGRKDLRARLTEMWRLLLPSLVTAPTAAQLAMDLDKRHEPTPT